MLGQGCPHDLVRFNYCVTASSRTAAFAGATCAIVLVSRLIGRLDPLKQGIISRPERCYNS